MPYLQVLLSESVKLMLSQYESGMMLQEWFKLNTLDLIILLYCFYL